ncbi:hypothetical protein AAEP93_002889 [Penicillium crustosum]
MYLLHNPYVFPITADIQTGWKRLETVHAEGKARDIGVSNFHRSHLEAVLEKRQHDIEVPSFKTLAPITVGKDGPLDLPLSSIARQTQHLNEHSCS